jgi:hypothetical protein
MARELPIPQWLVHGALAPLAVCIAFPAMASPQTGQPLAHQPTFVCTNTGALRVTCHGSFLDGTSAAGIAVRVLDKHDRVIHTGKVDHNGRITFRKPDAEFHVVFDAGQGNVLTLLASDMT